MLPLLVLNACRDEADKDWTTPEASFTLHDTTLGANVLYPTMKDNPFILTWDKVAGAGTYTVTVSKTEDFAAKSELGTSDTNILNTSIGNLNMAVLQLGITPYGSEKVFVRVEAGTKVSNSLSFSVTPYPVAEPVITQPTAGQVLVLDAANPNGVATTVIWTDYAYPITTNYTVEVAAHGSTAFVAAGSTVNTKQLSWTNYTLNDTLLGLGLPVGVASDVDVRVTSSTESAGGTITKTSQIVTFKVTTYVPAFVDFYLVGGGSAVGWDASKAQKLYRQNQISEIYTYLENNGEFRFLGQQDWGPINYSLNDPIIKAAYQYFNTWSANLQPVVDENMKFTGTSGFYKITIDQNARSIAVTSSAATLPAQLYLVGSIQGWNAGAAIPMTALGNGVYEHIIAIPDNSEFKFLGQQDWSGLEWGNIHTGGNSGYLGPNGDNSNIQFSGANSLYKITVNLKLGTYLLTPQ